MTRAIMINPGGTAGTWIDLGGPDINAALENLLGPVDLAVIHRDHGANSRGVHLAVYEYSLTNGEPHNDLGSRIVAALGHPWHVHGSCVLFGLNGPATVDLTDAQWRYLMAIAAKYVTIPAAEYRGASR